MWLCANVFVCFEFIAFITYYSTSISCQLSSEMLMYTADWRLNKDTQLLVDWNFKNIMRWEYTVDTKIVALLRGHFSYDIKTLQATIILSKLVGNDKCCNNIQLKSLTWGPPVKGQLHSALSIIHCKLSFMFLQRQRSCHNIEAHSD